MISPLVPRFRLHVDVQSTAGRFDRVFYKNWAGDFSGSPTKYGIAATMLAQLAKTRVSARARALWYPPVGQAEGGENVIWTEVDLRGGAIGDGQAWEDLSVADLEELAAVHNEGRVPRQRYTDSFKLHDRQLWVAEKERRLDIQRDVTPRADLPNVWDGDDLRRLAPQERERRDRWDAWRRNERAANRDRPEGEGIVTRPIPPRA